MSINPTNDMIHVLPLRHPFRVDHVEDFALGFFSVEAQQSVRSDAEILGAQLVVNCPDTPPLLIGQSFQCSATNENQEFFNVTVSLQRANGWIEWRVDNWGIYSMTS